MRLFKIHVVSVDVRNAMHTSLASSRMKNPISITDGSVNLTLDPHMGGSFLNFSANIDGERLDIMRTTPHDFKTPSDTASFLMAPYPNRIRDGKFQSLDVNIDACFAGWNGVAETVRAFIFRPRMHNTLITSSSRGTHIPDRDTRPPIGMLLFVFVDDRDTRKEFLSNRY